MPATRYNIDAVVRAGRANSVLKRLNVSLKAIRVQTNRSFNVKINTGRGSRNLGKLNTQAKNLETRFEKAEDRAKSLGQTLQGLNIAGLGRGGAGGGAAGGRGRRGGGFVGIGAGAGLIGGGFAVRGIIRDIVDVDRRLGEVNTLLSESQRGSLDLRKELVGISREGFDATEVILGFYQAFSLTGDPLRSLEIVQESARLARTGFAQLPDAVTLVSQSINGLQDASLSAARAGDAFATTYRRGGTTLTQLASEFPRLTSSAGQLGIELEDILGLFVRLTQVGFDPVQAGTSIQGVLDTINAPTPLTQAAIARTGINPREIIEQGGSLIDVFERLADVPQASLREFFPERTAQRGVLEFINNLQALRAEQEAFNNTQGEVARQTEAATNTISAQATILRDNLRAEYLETAGPAGQSLIDFLKLVNENFDTSLMIVRDLGIALGGLFISRAALNSFKSLIGLFGVTSIAAAGPVALAVGAPLAALAGIAITDRYFGPSSEENVNTALGNVGLPQLNEGIQLDEASRSQLVADTAELLRIQNRAEADASFEGDNARRLELANSIRTLVTTLNMNTQATDKNTDAQTGLTDGGTVEETAADSFRLNPLTEAERQATRTNRFLGVNTTATQLGANIGIASQITTPQERAEERITELSTTFADQVTGAFAAGEMAIAQFVAQGNEGWRELREGFYQEVVTNLVTTGLEGIRNATENALFGENGLQGFLETGLTNLLGSIGSGAGGAGVGILGTLLGFNQGGHFTVGGRGGIDNNIVAFRASRGEEVSVQPNGSNEISPFGGSGGVPPITVIVNQDPRAQERQIQSPRGQAAVINVIEQNSRTLGFR